MEDTEYYDELTLEKVHRVLTMEGGHHTSLEATEIISALQNAGILFRERR